jgi:hypothetical protein
MGNINELCVSFSFHELTEMEFVQSEGEADPSSLNSGPWS